MEKKKPKEAINIFEKIMKASVKEKKEIKPKKNKELPKSNKELKNK